MSKRIKWALLAMLGFSTACSTVKQSVAESDKQTPEEVAPGTTEHRVRVLYGVRRPEVQQPVSPEPAPENQPAEE